ncbi:MAG: carbohydrate kinase, YjeF related protein [Arthrobacter sp.]|nr:carbohydrate kinase, YjeF related protein [Arthrobacter sp.]MCU1548683.1 carbohydrate kinase, YjeF related protein [Arthrobacter sp.]
MSTPAESGRAEAVTPKLLRAWPLPGGGSSKDDRGSVLVIGGARKTPGAALLAGIAALRSGAGRLTLAVAESTAVQLAVALPEAGVTGLPENARGSVRGSGVESLDSELEAADAVLVGPGLDDLEETKALLSALLQREQPRPGSAGGNGNDGKRPALILDAYALGALPDLAGEIGPWAGRLILTPNLKEAGILLGRDVEDLHRDIQDLADKYRAVVSCQGVVAGPRKAAGSTDTQEELHPAALWEISTGHGGLGTSGSGDVLAGAIAGLRARGTTDTQAACWGTHLHAAAGDRLASRLGGLGYLARELTEELPPLMMELHT